jgi:hypothetical protein
MIHMFDVSAMRFERAPSGYLNLIEQDGTVYRNVRCIPLFPVTDPKRYVSVLHRPEKDPEEIGVIRSLDELAAGQRELVEADMRFRYFVPIIKDIRAINTKQGLDHWDVITDRGDREFAVRDRKENLTITERGMVFVTDVDQCRYRIPDIIRLNRKARARLEKMVL